MSDPLAIFFSVILDANGDRVRSVKRSIKLPLTYANASKRDRLRRIGELFRGAVNTAIEYYWARTEAGLTSEDYAAVSFPALPVALKNAAQRLAYETCRDTRKAAAERGGPASQPLYRGGLKLSGKALVELQLDKKKKKRRNEKSKDKSEKKKSKSRFDLWVSIQGLQPGKRLRLPAKATAPLRKWLAQPGAKLASCVEFTDDHMIAVVEFPQPDFNPDGEILGVDVGYTNLLATSRGELLGSDFKAVSEKVRLRKPGSKGRARAMRERDQSINRELNKLPWEADPAMQWPGAQAIALEDLTGIKHGKKKNQSKRTRKKLAPWRQRFVNERAAAKAEERGVLTISVPGWNNSRTCLACGKARKKSRQGELFRCVECGYVDHSDRVGAVNATRRAAKALPPIRLSIEKCREERLAGVEERKQKRAAQLAARKEKRAKTLEAKKKRASKETSTPGPASREQSTSAKNREAGRRSAPPSGAGQSSPRTAGRRMATESIPRELAPASAGSQQATAGAVAKAAGEAFGPREHLGEMPSGVGSLGSPAAPLRGAEIAFTEAVM